MIKACVPLSGEIGRCRRFLLWVLRRLVWEIGIRIYLLFLIMCVRYGRIRGRSCSALQKKCAGVPFTQALKDPEDSRTTNGAVGSPSATWTLRAFPGVLATTCVSYEGNASERHVRTATASDQRQLVTKFRKNSNKAGKLVREWC